MANRKKSKRKKSSNAHGRCDYCDRDAFYNNGLCKACYSAFYYWLKKTPGQVVKRVRQLDTFQARMEAISGNVSTHSRKRKAG